jgi:hypothetical protein
MDVDYVIFKYKMTTVLACEFGMGGGGGVLCGSIKLLWVEIKVLRLPW